MEIKEFIELYKANKKDAIQKINVKTYLPFLTKKLVIESLVKDLLFDNNGVYEYNAMDKYFTYTLAAITVYTDLEFSTDDEGYYAEYDELVQSGAFGEILEIVGDDYKVFYQFFETTFHTELEQKNSVSLQAGRVLSSLGSAIDLAIDAFDDKKVQTAITMFTDKFGKKKK